MSSYSWYGRLLKQLARPDSHSTRLSRRHSRQRGKAQKAVLLVETLEARDVPSASSALQNYHIILEDLGPTFDGGSGPGGGYTPAQVHQAYGVNQISFNGVAGDGTGETIAIIDSYNDPNIASDLKVFDKQFNLPNPNFKVINQSGGTTLPSQPAPGSYAFTSGMAETTLDVEWAHAMAPGANIVLVESTQFISPDLDASIITASKLPGVVAVSMSYGRGEYPGEVAEDSAVFNPTTNPDVVFIASTGDSGSPAGYPAFSPNVLAVGGTNLKTSSNGTYVSESGWGLPGDGSSAGGPSQYETQPAYQKGVVTQSTTKRTVPDVSLVADPETGVAIYQSFGTPGNKGEWEVVGGTSDAAPQWAGLIAIADQGRALAGDAPLGNATLMPQLYSLTSDFHDVTTGESLGAPIYKCGPGYDLVTGIGTPIANELIPALIQGAPAAQFAVSAPASVVVGAPFNLTVTAEYSNGKVDTGYDGTIDFTSSDADAALPTSYTFSNGVATVPVTLNTLDVQTVTVTDANNGATGTATTTVDSGDTFTVTGFPSSVTAGATGNDITVTAYGPDGSMLSGYTGPVEITSNNPSLTSFSVNLVGGTGTFPITLTTAGTNFSLTATDSSDSTFTGSEIGITVTPAAASQLVFIQQPTSQIYGSTISPAVTVAEEDPYNNIITSDNATPVTLSLSSNSTGATLSGGGAVTVVDGVATFSSAEVSTLGTGYTLTATSPGLASGISNSFSVVYNPILENFTDGTGAYTKVGGSTKLFTTTPAAAHLGTATMGGQFGGTGKVGGGVDENWYYRSDAAGQINPGDTVSFYVMFPNAATGRAYFGFGSTKKGTLSVVLAPNTNQFMIQNNVGYNTYTVLSTTPQSYSFNTWYLVQVAWSATGAATAVLETANGQTQLAATTAATGDTTPGDFAFRAVTTGGNYDYFSTVAVDRGATLLTYGDALPAAPSKPGGSGDTGAGSHPKTDRLSKNDPAILVKTKQKTFSDPS